MISVNMGETKWREQQGPGSHLCLNCRSRLQFYEYVSPRFCRVFVWESVEDRASVVHMWDETKWERDIWMGDSEDSPCPLGVEPTTPDLYLAPWP